MRRKLISYIIICALVFIPINSYADYETAIKYVTFSEKEWKQAQQDMLKYYNDANAFPKEQSEGNLPMNMYLKRPNGTSSKLNSYYFAYGDPEEGKYYTTLGLHKSLGQVYGGRELLFNPPYGWEFSWNWRKLEEWGQVKEPWAKGLCDEGKFDGKPLPASSGMKDLEECIQTGLDTTYGNMPYDLIKAWRDPEEAEKLIDEIAKGKKPTNVVFTKGAKPKAGGKWIDYVHITMLPTTKVWGQGYMYLKDGTAMPVPIAPFTALEPDIVPSISSPFQSTGAYNTDVVSADVVVKSSFESDETVDYQWMIKGAKSGKLYQSSEESQCVFDL